VVTWKSRPNEFPFIITPSVVLAFRNRGLTDPVSPITVPYCVNC